MELNSAQASPPSLRNYDDYRKFLFDFHIYKKQTVRGWSYRLFASRAEIQSPNYLQLVMKGERNLSEEKAIKVAGAMNLSVDERRYFVALVLISNARSAEEDLQAQREALRAQRRLMTSEMKLAQVDVIKGWYHFAVRELVLWEDFEFSGLWVSRMLNGIVSEEQAQKSLEVLVKAEMIKKNSHGRWVQSNPVIDSGPDGFQPALITDCHSQALKSFSSLVKKTSPENRELGLLTISMQQKDISKLKKKIREFQDEVIGMLGEESEPDCIVELGTYLLPLTDISD